MGDPDELLGGGDPDRLHTGGQPGHDLTAGGVDPDRLTGPLRGDPDRVGGHRQAGELPADLDAADQLVRGSVHLHQLAMTAIGEPDRGAARGDVPDRPPAEHRLAHLRKGRRVALEEELPGPLGDEQASIKVGHPARTAVHDLTRDDRVGGGVDHRDPAAPEVGEPDERAVTGDAARGRAFGTDHEEGGRGVPVRERLGGLCLAGGGALRRDHGRSRGGAGGDRRVRS